jgi:hypothetical protein
MTMFSDTPSFWGDRLKASAVHLLLSLCMAAMAALLVFGIWYPYPYREISGGRELFLLVVTVDVILGPLVTLAVFNRIKPVAVLRRDLAVIGFLQLAAITYGLWTVAVARPVHMVFEYDRFRVVHAIDVAPELLSKAPSNIVGMPLTGPTLLSLRPFKDSGERLEATLAALQGAPLSARPDLWQPYAKGVPDILKEAKPVSELLARFPAQSNAIGRVLADAGRKADGVVYLPMIGRNQFWTVFLDASSAEVVATMPLDSF